MRKYAFTIFLMLLMSCTENDSKNNVLSPDGSTEEEQTEGYKVSGFVIGLEGTGEGETTIELKGNDYLINEITGKQGYYTIENVLNGVYVLKAIKRGFIFQPDIIIITIEDEDLAVENINVIELCFNIVGRVLDENGNGIKNANIGIYLCDENGEQIKFIRIFSDENGYYTCNAQEADFYDIKYECWGFTFQHSYKNILKITREKGQRYVDLQDAIGIFRGGIITVYVDEYFYDPFQMMDISKGLEGVSIKIIGEHTNITTVTGFYGSAHVKILDYYEPLTITPYLEGYRFEPKSFENIYPSVKSPKFIAYKI